MVSVPYTLPQKRRFRNFFTRLLVRQVPEPLAAPDELRTVPDKAMGNQYLGAILFTLNLTSRSYRKALGDVGWLGSRGNTV